MHNDKRRPSVLIIEDDPFYRSLYVNQLKKLGSDFRLVTSENGYSALMSLGSKRPDLIILDLCMPRFDGASFLEVVKSNPAYEDLPVLVISGEISMLPDKGKRFPHTYVFQKPVHARVFERIVRLALNLAQTEQNRPDSTLTAQGAVDLEHMHLFIGDDPEMLRVISEQFVSLAPGRISMLANLVKQHDLIEIRHFCHGMQSTAATVGAHQLVDIIRAISHAAAEDKRDDLHHLAGQFAASLHAFCDDLSAVFSLTDNA